MEAKYNLEQLVEEIRNTPPYNFDPLSIVQAAKERDLNIDLDQLRDVLPRSIELAQYYTKRFIADFIGDYLADMQPERVIDPCAGFLIISIQKLRLYVQMQK